ncbi:dipeptidase [Sphingomonas sp. Leaf25]|uniref:dipeptidase n=1 Tax=Sphingomonas sp. Leaf25 TaxID=1735692 RepID=UPI0006F4D753|nr:dipeptidase [Sphingomonas sp. Leaf25]KQM96489.1 membrane dipeptidase [Sphingomonas sp. Leaf25]
MMFAPLLLLAVQATAPTPADRARAERVLARHPIIDGHNDLPWELRDGHGAAVETVDLTADTSRIDHPLQTDLARLAKGHVGGQFWSVWIPATTTGPQAVETTIEQIDIVRRMIAANPTRMALATDAADMARIARSGRIASLIGVEGGHQIDGRLSVLRQYRVLGVRYMTLTHGKSVGWADSSTDAPQANGLTGFGRQVVAEMNRLGMLVDVAHVSDATMAAVLAVSKAPVIASHSNARALADRPRNIPDALLAAIGRNGGVVMVNAYPAFLSAQWNAWDNARSAYAKTQGLPTNRYGARAPAAMQAWDAANPAPRVTAATMADHVEHIARIAGRAHVGIGGDYDGISGTGPEGMQGVDGYPLLFAELARRGWSDADLAALAQGNILRVLARAEAVATSLATEKPVDATWSLAPAAPINPATGR